MRRQHWIPSSPRTVNLVVIALPLWCCYCISGIEDIENICISLFTVLVQVVLYKYYILPYSCPSARRQRQLPSPSSYCSSSDGWYLIISWTFNNRELFLLLFTTNLFGLAIQRRVSSKEVNGAGILTTKKRFDLFVDTVGERSNLREHGLMTNCYLW